MNAISLQSELKVKSYSLESYRLLPGGNEAICKVRDLATGALRQVLASKLFAMSYEQDAYLLELLAKGGNK